MQYVYDAADVVHVVQLHSVTAGSDCNLQFLPYQQQDTD
jgi:hypothetical protein